ncbi:MAG: hypothetical protein ABIQ31_08465 [Ferruginibacter sp.]
MLRIVLEHFTDQKGLWKIVTSDGFSNGISNVEDTGLQPTSIRNLISTLNFQAQGSSPVSSLSLMHDYLL